MWVSLMQSVRGLNRAKILPSFEEERTNSLLDCLELGHRIEFRVTNRESLEKEPQSTTENIYCQPSQKILMAFCQGNYTLRKGNNQTFGVLLYTGFELT